MEILGTTGSHEFVIDTFCFEQTANPVSEKLTFMIGQITRRSTITSVLNISEGE